MKVYNRKTKRWEEADKAGSLKKRELCKGKRPHDFVLLIPEYIRRDHNLFKNEIIQYYQIEEERIKMNIVLDKRLNAMGILRIIGP